MYCKLKLSVFCFAIFMVSITFAQDTLFIKHLSYLDSSSVSLQMGVRPLIVDDSNLASLFYTTRGNTADSVFVTTSNNSGEDWTPRELISEHEHLSHGSYYAQGPTATYDDSGHIHILYPYRGLPLYSSSWSSYPPTHINYVTNESGSWETYGNIVDDEAIQVSEDNAGSVTYLYSPAIVSLKGSEYLTSFDYAWFSTKSHIVYSERALNGTWAEGSALVTYEREAIDKYTIYSSTIVTDQTDIHALWFNRYTGEFKVKTKASDVWGAEEVIHTSNYSIDGVRASYSMSSISDEGESKVVMTRMEDNWIYNELFFAENKGEGWTVDNKLVDVAVNSVIASEMNDTTNIFFRVYHADNNTYSYKYLIHTDEGFTEPAEVSLGESLNLLNIIVSEDGTGPLVYQYYNDDTEMWYLCSGEVGDLVITDINETNVDLPSDYSLEQNYPNPFNPSTAIDFHLPETGLVTIKIYDVLGQLVKTLVDDVRSEGSYSINWNGKDENERSAVSGIYICQMTAGDYKASQKMIMLK